MNLSKKRIWRLGIGSEIIVINRGAETGLVIGDNDRRKKRGTAKNTKTYVINQKLLKSIGALRMTCDWEVRRIK